MVTTQLPKATFVTTFKGDRFKDKGKGDEQVYFSNEERRVLQKLMKKLDSEAQEAREHAESSSDEEHFVPTSEKRKEEATNQMDQGLRRIFEAHGIKEDSGLMDELNKWKNTR